MAAQPPLMASEPTFQEDCAALWHHVRALCLRERNPAKTLEFTPAGCGWNSKSLDFSIPV